MRSGFRYRVELMFISSNFRSHLFFSVKCTPCPCVLYAMLLNPGPSLDSNYVPTLLRSTNRPSVFLNENIFAAAQLKYNSTSTQIRGTLELCHRKQKFNCHPMYEVCTLLVYSHPLAVWISPFESRQFGLKYQQPSGPPASS